MAVVKNDTIDLILSDIDMPGLSGLDLCRMLKQIPHTSEIPVVIMSGRDPVGNDMQAYRLGAVDYLSKPFSLDAVMAVIQRHLNP